jgi:hypothetical protein
MPTCANSTVLPLNATIQSLQFDALVLEVIQNAESEWKAPERRGFERRPYPQLIRLTPVLDAELKSPQSAAHVVGRNLALRGLDFYHVEPIPFRFAVVSLPRTENEMVHLLMKLAWCRFLRQGWYHSGGPFVRVVDSPL